MTLPKKPDPPMHVYLDNAATTSVDPEVLQTMLPYFSEVFANPSSLHSQGVQAKQALTHARHQVATFFGTQADTIIFTSGATEANNLAIQGVVEQYQTHGKHLITTMVEHASVLEVMKELEQSGYEVTYLPVDNTGTVSAKQVIDAIRPDTILVSIMAANNEIGTVQPIAEIGREILSWRKQQQTQYPLFHTDASQATLYLDLSVEKTHVDLMSVNGGKIYAPKGSGCLYKRRNVRIASLWFGGHQEFGVRSGTENIPAIIGFGAALERLEKHKTEEFARVKNLRDQLWQGIQKQITGTVLNGPAFEENRLPNNLHVSFSGIEAEQLIIYLDAYGIAVSSGSACSAESDAVSHVMMAIGASTERATSSIRFSFGKQQTVSEVEYVLKYLVAIASEFRSLK